MSGIDISQYLWAQVSISPNIYFGSQVVRRFAGLLELLVTPPLKSPAVNQWPNTN